MVDILDVLHQYVPKTTTTQTYDTCAEDGSTRTTKIHIDHINPIPIGGDQLTVARVRGSQDALLNSESGMQRVQGLIPVIPRCGICRYTAHVDHVFDTRPDTRLYAWECPHLRASAQQLL